MARATADARVVSTPWGAADPDARPGPAAGRILDAAWDCFTEAGVAATTVDQIARRAGLSRAWLYRHFENRDAVVAALVQREALRFLAGLDARFADAQPDALGPVDVVSDAFAYSVDFLRRHPLLNRLLETEPATVLPFLTVDAGPLLAAVVAQVAPVLATVANLAPGRSTAICEWLVREVVSCVLTPRVTLALEDPAAVAAHVAAMVGPLLR